MSQAPSPTEAQEPEEDLGVDSNSPALVMCFNATDPTGAGGTACDSVSVAAVGAHALPVVTGVVVRDTAEIFERVSIDSETVSDQARALLEDGTVHGFKIGSLDNVETISVVAELLADYSELPVVTYVGNMRHLDESQIDDYLSALREMVLSQSYLVCGNHRALAAVLLPEWDNSELPTPYQLAQAASECGAAHLVVTGVNERGFVKNFLFDEERLVLQHEAEAFEAQFIGAGDTLSAVLAGLIATGLSIQAAATEAFEFVGKNAALITAAYGLGENIVQGAVNPDEYLVFKPTLKQGFRPIVEKRLGTKEFKLICDDGGCKITKQERVTLSEQKQYALTDEEILQLARWTCIIEDHYSEVRGTYTPMDIEWAKDGETNELFIVQARPETVQSQKRNNILRSYHLQEKGIVLTKGRSVGEAIGQGKVHVILDPHKIDQFRNGEVLVTNKTDPDWEPIMKKASAIVTNSGGRTCHAAIIARELGIPAIVGCGNATDVLKTSQIVTVSCAEGEEGRVYAGLLPFEVKEVPLENLPRTRTKIMMNVGNPEEAFSLAAIPNDGVGLARLEFIIANHIKVHPLALIKFDELKDADVKAQIAEMTVRYKNKSEFFVDKLAQGMGKIAAAFYPNPVVVRMSDFKSNEYANLLGGRQFEPQEENPMLSWRGASRYYDERYRDAFALECHALKRVRDEMGLTNVIPMIPFCRTPEEGKKVLAQMAKHGLSRYQAQPGNEIAQAQPGNEIAQAQPGNEGLQVYVMCELPSNVILADEFSEVFDGFSIGSNDLTQLTLGLDRDSALVAHIFDERNVAVKRMVEMAIASAKRNNRKIGICGQAPSDYPEFARFLVELGIDSISLNPDSVLKTLLDVAQVEGVS